MCEYQWSLTHHWDAIDHEGKHGAVLACIGKGDTSNSEGWMGHKFSVKKPCRCRVCPADMCSRGEAAIRCSEQHAAGSKYKRIISNKVHQNTVTAICCSAMTWLVSQRMVRLGVKGKPGAQWA
jgi:hypothetical protein